MTLLVAHGVRGHPGITVAHAAGLRHRHFLAVRAAALDGAPSVEDALARDRVERVLPMLMADGYTAERLRRRLRAAGASVPVLPALGTRRDFPALVSEVATARARASGWTPAGSDLLLVAHGTRRHHGGGRTARRFAPALARGGWRNVRLGFLDQAPALGGVAATLDRPTVAVGLFMDDGPHGADDVRGELAGATAPVAYTGAVGAAPAVTSLIARALAAEPVA